MTRVADLVAPLFVPASRPDRFAKAAATRADAVVLDLEDAVAAADKTDAREALTVAFTDKPVIVRINAAGTPWHEDDLAAAARIGVAAVMLPKAEAVADVARVAAVAPVVALIETVRGIAAARDLARSGGVARIAFGSVDYAADLGCAHDRGALAAARAETIFASRLHGLPAPLDGVTTDVATPDAAGADAAHARLLGFGGKLVIHPRQVAPVLAGFAPDARELDWARRVLASGDGAVTIDGAMVDEPVRRRAAAVVRQARACGIST